MIEWIVLGIAIVSYTGFKVWAYFEMERRIKELEERMMGLLINCSGDLDKFQKNIENDLHLLRSHDEEIIHGIKDALTGIEQVDNVILDLVNNLSSKEEKKPKKQGKK
jgi:hypothetical protein